MWITWKKGAPLKLLKTISFRHFYIAQRKSHMPILMRLLDTLSSPFNHVPNKLVTLVGGVRPKVKCNNLHTLFANEQVKNKCSTDSWRPHKTHFVQPFQCLLSKLSLVNSTFLYRNRIKILILRGTFKSQIYFYKKGPCFKCGDKYALGHPCAIVVVSYLKAMDDWKSIF